MEDWPPNGPREIDNALMRSSNQGLLLFTKSGDQEPIPLPGDLYAFKEEAGLGTKPRFEAIGITKSLTGTYEVVVRKFYAESNHVKVGLVKVNGLYE